MRDHVCLETYELVPMSENISITYRMNLMYQMYRAQNVSTQHFQDEEATAATTAAAAEEQQQQSRSLCVGHLRKSFAEKR